MSTISYARAIHNAQPFTGEGASLYVTPGTAVEYRRARLQRSGHRKCLRQGWSGRNAKTLRVDSQSGVSGEQIDFAYDVSGLPAGTYTADVRHYKGGIENLTDNFRTVTFTIDGSADPVASIYGSATWLQPELRAGGVVLLRWVWHPVLYGVQPNRFRIVRTAGPTTPDDITVDVVPGFFEYDILTVSLSDASAYTFRLEAETDTVSVILLSGLSVTADATAPATPTLVSITAV